MDFGNARMIEPNTPLKMTNAPRDVPTILISGISAFTLDDIAAKVTFFEQTANSDGDPEGRMVVTLAMPQASLLQLRDTIVGALESYERAKGMRVQQ